MRKLIRYGILDKQLFPEMPPRTEYALTRAGLDLAAISAQIHDLEERIRQGGRPTAELTVGWNALAHGPESGLEAPA